MPVLCLMRGRPRIGRLSPLHLRLLTVLLLVAVVVGGGLAATAHATPTWLSPADLSSTGQDATASQVAVDAQGNATVV